MRFERLNDEFTDILTALLDQRAEFSGVGAFAVALQGYPRATQDLDIFVRASEDNARRVVLALGEFGAPLAAHGVSEADFAKPGAVYQLGQPPRRIDLMKEISGVTFDDAWDPRETIPFESRTVAFLGRDALIRNERASARPKDFADVARLEQLRPD